MDKVAIYYRVSTDKQDLDSQKFAMNAWLAGLKEQPKKITIIEDLGYSGKNNARPGFQRLMDMVAKCEIDTIVVYRLDRFGRNATVAIRILLDLDDHGVAFISVTQPVLNLGHENPFRRTILAAFAEIAEIERETIVARVKSGLDAARKRGVKLGPPTKITDKNVEDIKRLREEGMSYKSISSTVGLSIGSVHNTLKKNPLITK